jgi:hypothetical protein
MMYVIPAFGGECFFRLNAVAQVAFLRRQSTNGGSIRRLAAWHADHDWQGMGKGKARFPTPVVLGGFKAEVAMPRPRSS